MAVSLSYNKYWYKKTMNSFRSNHLSLKYQRFTPSGLKDI